MVLESVLALKMTDKLIIEVDVKNVTEEWKRRMRSLCSCFPLGLSDKQEMELCDQQESDTLSLYSWVSGNIYSGSKGSRREEMRIKLSS